MSTLDTLIQRNKDFAQRQTAAGAAMPSLPDAMPDVKAIVIGCADMRVDPAHVLGIKNGEAVVMRNIGGRVTPSLGQQLQMLGRIGEVAERVPGGGNEFHVIVLQHTDCGITRLAGNPEMLAPYFGVRQDEVDAKAVTDPRRAVSADVAILHGAGVPEGWLISGLVYDVSTGVVDVVVPPARSRATTSAGA